MKKILRTILKIILLASCTLILNALLLINSINATNLANTLSIVNITNIDKPFFE